jgi:hypothetical protein
MVRPTGWVVDMRHYIDEDTGDLPEVIPERVLSLPSSLAPSWRGSRITCPRATSTPMCPVGAAPGGVAVASTSSPNVTARLDTSSGSAHSAATTA